MLPTVDSMLKPLATLLVTTLLHFSQLGCAPLKASDRRRAELHMHIGSSHLAKGNYPAAMYELRIAEKLDPRNPTIQSNLGLAYFVRHKYAEAEKHIKTALALNPNYTDARNNLGRVYIELGLFDKAIDHLNVANKDLTYPYPDKTLTNLGIAHFNKGNYRSAKRYLKKSLVIRRNNCLTFHYYGRCLFELKSFKLAAESFDQAIPLCKGVKFDEPYYFGALSYFKLGDKSRAVARFEELLSQFPDGRYANQSQSMLKIIK